MFCILLWASRWMQPPNQQCPGLCRAEGGTAVNVCPCLSSFLGLQSLPPPYLPSSSYSSPLILLFSFPPVLSHQQDFGTQGVQSPTSRSLLCLPPLQLCHHGDWCLGVLGSRCVPFLVFFTCFVSVLCPSHLTSTVINTSWQEAAEVKVRMKVPSCYTPGSLNVSVNLSYLKIMWLSTFWK